MISRSSTSLLAGAWTQLILSGIVGIANFCGELHLCFVTSPALCDVEMSRGTSAAQVQSLSEVCTRVGSACREGGHGDRFNVNIIVIIIAIVAIFTIYIFIPNIIITDQSQCDTAWVSSAPSP